MLEGAGMRDVLPLAKARVPVVKCIAPETGTKARALAGTPLQCGLARSWVSHTCSWCSLAPKVQLQMCCACKCCRCRDGVNSGSQVDVTLNNTLAIINTKLLADYCAIDGRLTQLAFIVKHWAKRRQVRCPPLLCVAQTQLEDKTCCARPGAVRCNGSVTQLVKAVMPVEV